MFLVNGFHLFLSPFQGRNGIYQLAKFKKLAQLAVND
jgi:hypothetical protein